MQFLRFARRAAACLALLFAAGMAQAQAPTPRLVVFIAIDGLPQWQVLHYRDQLVPDGFARFLERGSWFAQASQGHGFTVTASGHAAMLTGAYPRRTGIIGNEWLDPRTGKEEYNTADAQSDYLGQGAREGTSPRNLKAETLGEVMRRVNPAAKVVTVSGKDRGAILLAGHTGAAYMYLTDNGEFSSTTYYMPRHPAWVERFNARKPADRYFRTEWKPLLPEAAYERSIADGQSWFGKQGGALPMVMGSPKDEAPGKAFYGLLLASPFIDQLELDFARAAIEGEGLGADDVPDLLGVSLSGHDYVNHRWSAESRLSHDHFLRLDRMLQDFFAYLDQRIGRDRYLVVLTADHGFMPAVEVSLAKGLPAGRFNYRQAVRRINEGLAERFGAGRWVVGFSAATLMLDKATVARSGANLAQVTELARSILVQEPGIDTAYTRQELIAGNRTGERFFEAAQRAFHPDVSADIQLMLKPWWAFGGSSGATHGSPHAYDAHVPILFWGPKWAGRGRVDAPVEVVDIASTLSRVLGIARPAQNEGRPLPLPSP